MESFVVPGERLFPLKERDGAMLTRRRVTVETVERAAGLTLFSDAIKNGSKHICKTTKCDVIVRRFDNAQKKPKAVSH